jgi:hypothetical protein
MAVAWFVTNYKRLSTPGWGYRRYCAMDDFSDQIAADGGAWAETEVLGGYAIVKVRADAATLTLIAGTAGFYRVPLTVLDNTLASLTAAQRNAIQARIEAMGYTVEEITAAFPNLRNATLRQVLRFAASRRRKPRYDAVSDAIMLDGEIVACRSVEDVDAEIQA